MPWYWWLLTDLGGGMQHCLVTAAAAKSLQSCPTLCDPIYGSPAGSPVPGILQARIREWVAISFSNAWKWKVKVKSLSHVWLFTTPWTVAYQAPPSMGVSRQEYWSGLPLPSPCGFPTHCLIRFLLKEELFFKTEVNLLKPCHCLTKFMTYSKSFVVVCTIFPASSPGVDSILRN